ncbi:DUF4230 domain-containing protein [Runella slithyformis]|uniref:DUF4230 domain-containing protein n=1 Tax=Runella slithyformis (strain ATCC 29530 / DSM 19594 / LMG 11500 / NCIMB 11436 / LSU 4) TaxID=761193 RepID=A0A7U4E6F5_RUNSL|nr:DUF4230 domain-containing protein [Runella slithyformis]AEI49541.1 hypothetical protein Runsl_3160 [Runella slithyformis DSM 19594]
MTAVVRLLLRLLLFAIIIVGIISVWEGMKTGKWFSLGSSEETETTHAMVLEEVQSLGKLELVRYNFKDIVEHEQIVQWFPNPKAILIVQGEAIGCIDLTKITTSDITTESDTVVIHLPEPELCTYKIDHTKSKVYNTEYAFTEEAKLVQEAYRQAEKQIQQSALDMGILNQTKQNANLILKPMLEKISGKKVVLRYRLKATIPNPR